MLLSEASPLERLLGFYRPLDCRLPLGPAVLFRDARVECVEPFDYPLTPPLRTHRRAPFCTFSLTPVFDLALVEKPDGLPVKLLLGTAVSANHKALVLLVIAGCLNHRQIAPKHHQSCSPNERLHPATRLWVTGVQHLGKSRVTREYRRGVRECRQVSDQRKAPFSTRGMPAADRAKRRAGASAPTPASEGK